MEGSFGSVLSGYRGRLLRVIRLLNSFVEEGKVEDLVVASSLLINAGNDTYASFEVYSHVILPAISIQAGLELRKRASDIKRRGVMKEDKEYVIDIRQLFKRIADTIDSGEYEREYRVMVKKARGVSRIAG